MNEAVVDGMSRREVVNALDSRGIEYRDLLEVEDADLRAGACTRPLSGST